MRYFSKSQFTRAAQCSKSLYLYRHQPELQDPVSPEQQSIFDNGTAVGILAQKWLPGGVLIKADHQHPEDALKDTRGAIAAGAKVLYEAAFEHDGVLVRADIIARNVEGGFDLFEVKSTTEVEDEHLLDAAIQVHVLRGAGLRLDVAHVVHLNPEYVRVGSLKLESLFTVVDVNAAVERILPNVPARLAQLKADDARPEPPAAAIGPHCTKPHDCSFLGHCWAHVPDYSVFDLAYARKDRTTELWNKGIKTVDAIPEDEKLSANQTLQRAVAISRKPHVNVAGIRKLLEELVYPLHFLDFEAVNPAVPPYQGTRPYQQIPFEASIHVQQQPGAPLEHFEFLSDGTTDPRPDLIEFLIERVSPSGSTIAYNKPFENSILNALASFQQLGDGVEARLLSIGRRLWDVADPIRKGFYVHPDFKGRWSLKAVLPVLCPDLSYKDLAIQNGAQAMAAYTRLMTETMTPEERARIMADLLAYCGTDTLAMARILDFLEHTANLTEAAR